MAACLAAAPVLAQEMSKPDSPEVALTPDPDKPPPPKTESESTATLQPERQDELERAKLHEAEAQKHDPERHRLFGVGFDIGLPDGLAVNLTYRPIKMLRIEAAPLYNLGGFGIRGGVTFIPIDFVISPTLTFEVGHYFSGDFNKAQAMFTHAPIQGGLGTALSDIQYTYGNLQVGMEIGSYRSVMFTLHLGLSYLDAYAPKAGAALQSAFGDSTLQVDGSPHIKAIIPSAKIGLLVFFG